MFIYDVFYGEDASGSALRNCGCNSNNVYGVIVGVVVYGFDEDDIYMTIPLKMDPLQLNIPPQIYSRKY